MANKKNHSKKNNRGKELYCPVCGSRAVIKTAREVIGEKAVDPDRFIFVCSRYDQGCNTYVYAAKGSKTPLGEMADPQVRNLRIRAHKAIDAVVNSGVMSKRNVYDYLADHMGCPIGRFHLAECGRYGCEETIRLMQKVMDAHRQIA